MGFEENWIAEARLQLRFPYVFQRAKRSCSDGEDKQWAGCVESSFIEKMKHGNSANKTKIL